MATKNTTVAATSARRKPTASATATTTPRQRKSTPATPTGTILTVSLRQDKVTPGTVRYSGEPGSVMERGLYVPKAAFPAGTTTYPETITVTITVG